MLRAMSIADDHAAVIRNFYSAFARKDGAAMAALYAPDARFSDPVFPSLDGRQAGAMWRMFCEGRDTELRVEFSDVVGDERGGRAHWDAQYLFGPGKRPVLNRIDASFEIRDGRIVRHEDRFDFWKWTRMALGAPGVLLGWSPIVQNAVRKQARARLDAFLAKNG